jgi:hypothetical protein
VIMIVYLILNMVVAAYILGKSILGHQIAIAGPCIRVWMLASCWRHCPFVG